MGGSYAFDQNDMIGDQYSVDYAARAAQQVLPTANYPNGFFPLSFNVWTIQTYTNGCGDELLKNKVRSKLSKQAANADVGEWGQIEVGP
jgi:hypothetical protein